MTTGVTETADTPVWPPPTEIERLLHEATTPPGTLALLARTTLFLPVARLQADIPDSTALPAPIKDPKTGKWSIPALTTGMLPPWHPEWVHQSTTLAELARSWPDGSLRLAVNPGTPCAVTVKAWPHHRRAWLKAGAESGGPPRGLLLADSGGPSHGSLAHGLACGAHLSVHNSVPWNRLGTTYTGYRKDVAVLRGTWRVTNRARYRDTLAALFEARFADGDEESALRARAGKPTRPGRTPAPDVVQRIARYEERFRTDGVLGADERVDSLAAFDYGRVIVFVRMALGARLCEPHEAEEAVLRAGRLSRERYASWDAFSAAYALARVLAFDNDTFGETYQESVIQHRILTQDPASPYRSLPWS